MIANAKYTCTSALDPATGRLAPLFHPRRQRWQEHFRWARAALPIVGITQTGRATVERLQLNRANVMSLRRVLHRLGFHPLRDE